jgi:hypothetical protein
MSRGKWSEETKAKRAAWLASAREKRSSRREKSIDCGNGWIIKWFDELNYTVSHNGQDEGRYFSRLSEALLYICDRILYKGESLATIEQSIKELIVVAQRVDNQVKTGYFKEAKNGN